MVKGGVFEYLNRHENLSSFKVAKGENFDVANMVEKGGKTNLDFWRKMAESLIIVNLAEVVGYFDS